MRFPRFVLVSLALLSIVSPGCGGNSEQAPPPEKTSAASTAFPQPAPGKAKSPGPVKNVPADRLRRTLGLARVNYVASKNTLAVYEALR